MMSQGHYSLNHNNLQYNKDIIKEILYKSTGKYIEIFLSHNNSVLNKNNMAYVPATDELIEYIKIHLVRHAETPHLELAQNFKYYLVINCNQNELVNTAYIGYLHYSEKCYYWKCDLLPLTHINQIKYEHNHIEDILKTTKIRLDVPEIYHYFNMNQAHISYILEHARLRMKYFKLNSFNFEQYKQEFTHIYSQTPEYLMKIHEYILSQQVNNYNPSLQVMDHLLSSYNELSISEENSDNNQHLHQFMV